MLSLAGIAISPRVTERKVSLESVGISATEFAMHRAINGQALWQSGKALFLCAQHGIWSAIATIAGIAAVAGLRAEALICPKISPMIARTGTMLRSHDHAFIRAS